MKGAARVRRDQIDEKSLPPFLLPYTIARFHDRNFVLLEIEIVIAVLGFFIIRHRRMESPPSKEI